MKSQSTYFFQKITVVYLLIFLFSSTVQSKSKVGSLTEIIYTPTEKSAGVVKNPGMGWVLYCDAFRQMIDPDMLEINKGVYNPELFWETFDQCGATKEASIFYLRAPWSFYEPTEGNYGWNDPNSNYSKLVQGALDRNLRLAFRVYVSSQHSYQQATPQYVRDAGAKGDTLNSTYIKGRKKWHLWSPYANDTIFLKKFKQFITAFGQQYNHPTQVDFIDGFGMGNWGEGHWIRYDNTQPKNNLDEMLTEITDYYRASFPHVLLGASQAGNGYDAFAEKIVLSGKYDILRRDSYAMPNYFPEKYKTYYKEMFEKHGISVFAENGYQYFHSAPEFGTYFSEIRPMLINAINDVMITRANTFDFRTPEDAQEWMKNKDIVEIFSSQGGYRFVPIGIQCFSMDNSIAIHSVFKNTGIGRLPSNRIAWKGKYKVAYQLTNCANPSATKIIVTEIDPSDWIKGSDYKYENKLSLQSLPKGTYQVDFSIVDTTNENQPSIQFAIKEAKEKNGWYKVGKIAVSKKRERK